MHSFGTHLPILNLILDSCVINNVFEYGMGSYSTPLFADKCKEVLAVEMQETKWYSKMVFELKEKINCKLICLIGTHDAIEYFKQIDKKNIDLVFVDGSGETRFLCINEAINSNIPYIVAHDTEEPGYRWDLVELKGYTKVDVKRYSPWTSVYSKNLELIQKLKDTFA